MKTNWTDEELINLIDEKSEEQLQALMNKLPELKQRVEAIKEVLEGIKEIQEVEVPDHVHLHFQEALLKEKSKGHGSNPWMQVAAAVAILIVGFSLGKLTGNDAANELAMLNQQVQSLREVTLAGTLQRHSASERIQAVSQIEQRTSINPNLVTALISTLNSDESPNVRYAALQALEKFIGEANVREALVKSLEHQSDPLIQISLITILVEAEERSAIAPIEELMNQDELSPEVKQQAEIALQVLT